MYLSPDNRIINEGDAYTSANGTYYPSACPKSEIPGLIPVSLSDRPVTTQYQDATFRIENGGQVWVVTDWSQERIAAYQKSLVPVKVKNKSARRALLNAGLLDTVIALFAAMPGPEGAAARIDFEYTDYVHRDSSLVSTAIALLGLTDDQADDLFIAAEVFEME